MTTDEPGAVPPPPTAPLPSGAQPDPASPAQPDPTSPAQPDPTSGARPETTDVAPSAPTTTSPTTPVPAPSAPVFGAPSPGADLAPAAPYGAAPVAPLPTTSSATSSATAVPPTAGATPTTPPVSAPAAAAPANPYGPPPVPAAPAYGPPAANAAPATTAPQTQPGAPAPGAPAPGAPAPGAPALGAPAYGSPGYGAGHGAPPPYLAPGTGQPGGFPPGGPQPAGKGMAITALVLAGVALLLSWVPLVNYLAGVLAVAGLVVGVVALVKARPGRGLAIAGVIVAVVSVAMVVASHAVYARLLTEFVQQVEQSSISSGPAEPFEVPPADPSAEADPFAPDDAPADEPTEALAVGFDQPFTYEDGLVVTVGAPQPYVPSETAVTGPSGEHLRMTVTVQNGTAEDFDPTLFLAGGTSAGAEAEQIFDFENGLDMPPSDAVPPGGSVQFEIAFTVPDPASFAIEVSPSFVVYEPFVVSAG